MSRRSPPCPSSEPQLAVGQPVYLREPLPQIGLSRGALGAVVTAFTRPRMAYEVEFVGENGETRALTTLLPKQVSVTKPIGYDALLPGDAPTIWPVLETVCAEVVRAADLEPRPLCLASGRRLM